MIANLKASATQKVPEPVVEMGGNCESGKGTLSDAVTALADFARSASFRADGKGKVRVHFDICGGRNERCTKVLSGFSVATVLSTIAEL